VEAKVQKWGNSLAVRIPRPFAAELGLEEEAHVTLRVSEGAIVITPVSRRTYRLDELLAGVRRSNLHDEVDAGRPRGDEAW
jgi:antitoxin MazE